MSFINFQEANCKNCYRCIRSCSVKAIEFKNNQARIIDDECIYCCNCLKECPQNAKTVESDLPAAGRLLSGHGDVVASVAPSFAAYFDDPEAFKQKLYDVGFSEVRETAEAAEAVSRVYAEHYRAKGGLITTACPVIVEFIQKRFPHLIGWMAPVDSPMVVHAKWIKEQRPGAKVVFIGPCYAKKKEMIDQPGTVDAVLTFDCVDQLRYTPRFGQGETQQAKEEPAANDVQPQTEIPMVARLYPVEGGVIETTFSGKEQFIRHRAISGIDNCQRLFQSMKDPEGYFLELNACEGGCVNGPIFGERSDLLEMQNRVMAYMNGRQTADPLRPTDLAQNLRTFRDLSKPPSHFTDTRIQEVLRKIGKTGRDDELNCGACGYHSCREKAKAVLDGKAELYMCMPYMQARAESFAHTVLEKTPNAVIAVSDQLLVKEANNAAADFFELSHEYLIGMPLPLLLDPDEVSVSPNHPVQKKLFFPDLHKTANVSISYVHEQQLYLLILHDLTEREQEQEKLQVMKRETMEMAQKVIDNQMRVVQEIASLLGETTAETKVTLTKLKRLLE